MPSSRRRSMSALAVGAVLSLGGLTAAVADDTTPRTDPGQTRLLKDIDPGRTSGLHGGSTVLRGHAIFTASDAAHGSELWISDGTTDGTRLLKDIQPGTGSGDPSSYIEFDGRIFFRSSGTTPGGSELWATDGTPEGTARVKDIEPGEGGSDPSLFEVIGDELWFNVFTTSSTKSGVWVTDGTEAGTRPVKTATTTESFSASNFLELGNGLVAFTAYDEVHGSEPWVSDGTESGTRLVKDIIPGRTSSITVMHAVGGRAVFSATGPDQSAGSELWTTDGTANGTHLLKDINPGRGSSWPSYFAPLGSNLIFRADTPGEGSELWTTDGTAAGTSLVRDINPGSPNSWPGGFTEFKGRLYFAVDTAVAEELWATGGTRETTVPVKRLRTREDGDPGYSGNDFFTKGRSDSPGGFRPSSDLLYFGASGVPGGPLWATDGTTDGTYQLTEPPGTFLLGATQPIGDGMLVRGLDETHGQELWSYEPKGVNRALSRPTVSAARTVGQRLTASPGQYAKPSRHAYQWLRDGRTISGATGSSYLLQGADAGRRLSVRVTATFPSDEPVVSTSAATGVVRYASTTSVRATRSGRTVTLDVAVDSRSPGATRGKIVLKDGSRTVATRTLTNGRVRIVLRDQARRRHVYRVDFAGTSTVAASSTTRAVTVG